MSKHPIKMAKAAPTDRELDAALHASLQKQGMLFPRTEEDLKVIEAHVGSSHLFQPNLKRFKALLSDHVAGKSNVVAFKQREADSEVLEDFAQAARNGADIPDAIKQKMTKNRSKAEEQLAAKKLQRDEKR